MQVDDMRCVAVLIVGIVLLHGHCFAADDRLSFNRAVELTRGGQYDAATEILRQTAASTDKNVAARSLALLGQIDVVRSKDAEDKTEYVDSAEQRLTDSLTLQENAEVRNNLEEIRSWRSRNLAQREESERIQKRNAELQQRIQALAGEQSRLTAASEQAVQETISPKLFQENYESARSQHLLAEELSYLAQTPVDGTDEAAEELKAKWMQLPEMQKIAESAAQHLAEHNVQTALPLQVMVRDFLQSLIKKQDNNNQQQNDQQDKNQDDKQDNQNQQQQQQNTKQQENNDGQEPQNEKEQQPKPSPADMKEETDKDKEKEKAERMLLQVRRKEKEAQKRREQFKIMQQQLEPVDKDW
ncbi:hypothetical protein FACS1894170_11600 [Planctomycetales bacterium]|nr:hypothetical protein FACS1894170_11600 [Planctomycetales bacterium]